jgi:hypothetical protein
MQVVKKAYDKDEITLDDYLKYIRMMSKKQARKQIKLNKLLAGDRMDQMMNALEDRFSQMSVNRPLPGGQPMGQPM